MKRLDSYILTWEISVQLLLGKKDIFLLQIIYIKQNHDLSYVVLSKI